MKKEIFRLISILIIILFFSYFVYPTPYYYAKGGPNTYNFVYKINRFTGNTQFLTTNGWEKAEKPAK